jgi:H+/Cl- antiporter ClcA
MPEDPAARPVTADPTPPKPSPGELLRSRNYLVLLLLGALVGVPIATVAYLFLGLVSTTQTYVFKDLPENLGFASAPLWWPVVPLALSGLIVGFTLTHLHGTGGHRPAEGFHSGGTTDPADLPGIFLAALATLCLGAVLGPEAPLIAIGTGMGALAVTALKKDAPQTAVAVIGGAGAFAAISTLLGSPIVGAFLLMEAAGLAGAMLDIVLVPGLLAAGIGALIFVGLDNWTGWGSFSLAIPNVPPFHTPTVVEFLWAVAIGVGAALIGGLIRRAALALQPVVERRRMTLTPVVGVAVAVAAILFEVVTDRSASNVLFSGQEALPKLVADASSWSVGALVALVIFKTLAYCLSLSSFRGGPIFPSMFIGAALGMALSHVGGLPMIAGVGIGIGAMTVAMLGLPMVSVLLPSLLLGTDAIPLMPLVIVAVVTAYVTSARIAPAETSSAGRATAGSAAASSS